MINDTFDKIPLSPKWRAFFEKHRQRLANRDFPGMFRSVASRSCRRTAAQRKNKSGAKHGE